MADHADASTDRLRGIPARIGICLLNLIAPGLGLIRLSRFRSGLIAIMTSALSAAALPTVFAWSEELQASGYLTTISVVVGLVAVNLCVTIRLSWRWSRGEVAHPQIFSRWYGIVGAWLVMQLAFWPLPDLARSYYHPYFAPSVSMAPTIEVGDRFVAHMRDFDPLQRGDLVIVAVDGQEFVKRVAGLPGDRIAMHGGLVVINGAPMAQQKIGTEQRSDAGASDETFTRLREQFPGEARAHEVLDRDQSPWDETNEVELGKDQFFLLGDNRDNSVDSRMNDAFQRFGPVNRQQIVGRIRFRVWRRGLAFDPAPI